MPHQCTDCGRAFDDGSKEMLSGCPNCDGNTFQFRPNADPEELEASPPPDEESEPPEPPEPAGDSSVARTVGKAATTVRDFVGSDSPGAGAPDPSPSDATTTEGTTAESASTEPGGSGPRSGDAPGPEPDRGSDRAPSTASTDAEDTAQASARSDIVEPDEVRAGGEARGPSRTKAAERIPPSDDDGERPGLSQLRAELNEQFESIKVLEPGQYELNLMELYDREEYIIALQEDGKYTIQVPDGFGDG